MDEKVASKKLEGSNSLETVSRLEEEMEEGNGIATTTTEEDSYCWEEEHLLEAFSAVANIEKAWCRTIPAGLGYKGKGGLDVVVAMSQRNLPGNCIRKFLSSAHIPEPQGDLSFFHWAPFPLELTGVSLVIPSPSGNRLLLVRNGDPGKDPGPVKFEVWGSGRLLKELFVPQSVHGTVYNDNWFEGVSWNSDETKIAYVAEEPQKARPVFGQRGSSENPPVSAVSFSTKVKSFKSDKPISEAPSEAGSWKGRGAWQEDWGERYTGKLRPQIYLFDIQEGTVQAVEGIPDGISAGQVVWGPTVNGTQDVLVYVGWSAYATNFGTHKRLGMVYCYNRPCALYSVLIPGASVPSTPVYSQGPESVKLTNGISSAFAPRFSPDGALLVFLSAHAAVDSGAHAATNSLHSVSWPPDSVIPPAGVSGMNMDNGNGEVAPLIAVTPAADLPIQTIIDVVPRAEEAGGFPGLYCSTMIAFPWLSDNRTLLLTTSWRSTQAIIAVHMESGRVSRLTPEGPISWSLSDVRNNVVVAGASTPACPTKLMLGRINTGWLKAEGWLWSEISPPHVEYSDEVELALKATEFEVISIPVVTRGGQPLPEGAKQPFEAIFVRRQGFEKAVMEPSPLVVVPHGGPHGVTATTFSMPYAYLCALGFSVLHVNYRGSLGFGEEALQSLPKNVGRQDVADVLAALDKVISLGYADGNKVAVVGGSHGGFLAAHLIGQVPDRFKTAVLRNPVCNLVSMVSTSDIPDWCFVETLGAQGVVAYSDNPGLNELQSFYRASPISHASKVKVPSLFLLGGADRRVPTSNGLQFAQVLRSQGLEVKIIYFPDDNHAIDKPQSEFEQWVNVATWLKKYLN